MPITAVRRRQFKPAKTKVSTYESFRKGLNTLLRDSELGSDQVKDMTNLVLTGKGIVTQRPGTQNYHQASANGKIRGLFGSNISNANELLAISDDGLLTKKSGASYSTIAGASWASGEKVRMMQLQGKVYIVQKNKPLTRYDGTTLLSYTTLTSPTALTATNLSGVTGTFTWSWRVAAYSDAGRTLAADAVTLDGLPEDLSNTSVQISWTAPSAASGTIKGYEIYGREQGGETRLTGVPSETTSWIDDGTQLPSQLAFLPDFNETGGPNAKYVIKSIGKVILGNIANYPSRMMWSGADVNVGKFHYTKGGGYIDIDKDDGTEITGIAEASENRIIVFKERSIHQVKLEYNADLGIVEAIQQKITDAVGCLSHDTIQVHSNDHYFVGRSAGSGVAFYSLGYQPNILANVLRTAEISGSIRPDLDSVNRSRFEDMFGMVFDSRYWWFIPQGTTNMSCYTYDYEREAWSGPITFPENPVVGAIYYDSAGEEHFLYGNGSNGYISEASFGLTNDKGTDFSWSFQSKRENFDEPFRLKTLLKAFYHLTNVSGGTVNVQVLTEKEDGLSNTESAEAVTAPSTTAGWGSFPYGYQVRYGSSQQISSGTTNSPEIRKYMDLNASDVASAAFKLTGTGVKCDIIELQMEARPQTSPPASWRAST